MIVTNRRQLRDAFREMRLNRKLTQTQLAAKLHVHYKTVLHRERDAVSLDIETVLQTADAFGYHVALTPHARVRPTGTGWPA